MTLYQILQTIGLPCAYSHFRKKDAPKGPPYIVYRGAGQEDFGADDTYYERHNLYQIEYYFTEKNEETETMIEDTLLENGFLFTKSEDVFIENEGVFVIYYQI